MDGNGRWANAKGLPRISGHREGVRTVRKITEICGELNVRFLTLYTFSSENWNRPITEVSALMKLLVSSLRQEVKNLMMNNVRFTVIGDIDDLDLSVQHELLDAIQKTKHNTGLNLNLVLSYGSRKEILSGVKFLSEKIVAGEIDSEQINETLFSQMLYTKDIPDPDLLIRTGGEFRISNFLLWQIAYTEIFFVEKLWPDFNEDDLNKIIIEFKKIKRNFGKI